MAGYLTLEKKNSSSMEAAKNVQQPPTPAISRATKSRIQRSPLSDLTNVLTSSKGAPFSPVANSRGDDSPGTSSNPLGLNSVPSCDVPYSSGGHGVESQTIYRKAVTTRDSKGKEILASCSVSSHNGRSSRIRKRPGEVEARAVSKSCSKPNREVRKSPTEAGDRAISKSCTLPNKRKGHRPPAETDEASKSLQEFIRQQKSYFAEIDAFELPEEEASIGDSE